MMGNIGPESVEEMKAKGDVDGLIEALGDQKNSDVRKAAADALGHIRDSRAVEPLLNALFDKDNVVRCAVAKALGNIGDIRAVIPLTLRLTRYPRVEPYIGLATDEEMLAFAAAGALGEIGDIRAVEALITMLQVGDLSTVAAAESLIKFGATAVDQLIPMLKFNDKDVRCFAANALGRIGDERAVEPLIHMLHDDSIDVCRSAAEALEKLGWKSDEG